MLRSFGTEPMLAAILDESGDPAAEAFCRALGAGAGVLVPALSGDTVEALVAELDSQLCQGAKQPLTLIGFGFGAWLALLYAARHTDMAKRLVLIGCPPLERMPGVVDPPARDFRAIWQTRTALRVDGTLSAVIGKLPCPVHVLHGEHDTLPVEGVVKPLAREFAAFETDVLYGCGHAPHKQEKAIAPLCELLWSLLYEQYA